MLSFFLNSLLIVIWGILTLLQSVLWAKASTYLWISNLIISILHLSHFNDFTKHGWKAISCHRITSNHNNITLNHSFSTVNSNLIKVLPPLHTLHPLSCHWDCVHSAVSTKKASLSFLQIVLWSLLLLPTSPVLPNKINHPIVRPHSSMNVFIAFV